MIASLCDPAIGFILVDLVRMIVRPIALQTPPETLEYLKMEIFETTFVFS